MARSVTRLFVVAVLLGTAGGAFGIDNQGGYADRTSVAQGEVIRFSVATSVAPFSLQIVNLARPTQVLTTISGLTAPPRDCTGLWESGCGWPVTAQLTIPTNWPSGYYAAKFPTGNGTRNVIFVVKAAVPGSSSPMVIVSSTNTYTAYNNFGGKSVYDSNSTAKARAHTISFNRPYHDNAGLGRFPAWEQQFVNWLTAEGRSYEVITDDDLESAAALDNYKVVVLVGHSEYWTLTARQHLEAFRNGGGHLAIFSGNTMWWQARLNLTTRQFTCYKSGTLDPQAGVNNAVVTTNFFKGPVYNPENTIVGASFRHGEYANLVAPGVYQLAPPEQRTPYTVVDASSWVFAGTGLANGQQFAKHTGGFEVDGVTFNTTASGALQVDGSDGTPLNFRILATLPAQLGYGVIGLYTNPSGGAVFNAATQSWSHGLASDAAVQQVTRNVLDRLSTGAPEPYVAVTTPYLSEDLFNTPSPVPGILPNWDGGMDDATLSARCASEGALGLELKGTSWLELRRDFSPFNTPYTAAEVSFALNLDLLQQTADWPIPLVQLMGRGSPTPVYGAVEVQIRTQGKSIRFSTFRADGSTTSSTAWQVLAPGWHTIRASWRSPGVVALQVDAQPQVEAFNAETGQAIHDVFLEFPGTNSNSVGSLCIDALRVIEGTCEPAFLTQQPQSQIITNGSSATLSVAASGTAPLSYQWFAGTTPINGATGSSVTVSPTSTTTYFVRVTNGCGTVGSNSATITVQPCPAISITLHPAPASIPAGATTSLSVRASGTSLTYQWYIGAAGVTTSPIANATSSTVIVSPSATTSYWVRVSSPCTALKSTAATVRVAPLTATSRDFTGDGRPDVLWRNVRSGDNALWPMTGLTRASGDMGIPFLAPPWQIAAAADFNRDGRPDIVWRNTSTGDNQVWLMNGTKRASAVVIQKVPDLNWQLVGTGDFDQDGYADIIWRNAVTGQNDLWMMNGTAIRKMYALPVVPVSWKIVGSGQFGDGGSTDILWRNTAASGEIDLWLMNGPVIGRKVALPASTDQRWQMVAIADYNSDGHDDIVWRNNATLENAFWIMDGPRRAQILWLAPGTHPDWTIVGPK